MYSLNSKLMVDNNHLISCTVSPVLVMSFLATLFFTELLKFIIYSRTESYQIPTDPRKHADVKRTKCPINNKFFIMEFSKCKSARMKKTFFKISSSMNQFCWICSIDNQVQSQMSVVKQTYNARKH